MFVIKIMICLFCILKIKNITYIIVNFMSSYVLTKTCNVYIIFHVSFKQNNLLKDKA